MAQLFVEVFSLSEDEARVNTQSAICLFLLSYLQHPVSVPVTLVVSEPREPSLKVRLGKLQYRQINVSSIPSPIGDCQLPVFTSDNSTSCVAGLCAVLRQIVKHSGKEWRHLLGFRDGCLFACAEVSLWTKFCEIDVIQMVDNLLTQNNTKYTDETSIPSHIARFEEHLKQPVRMHNIDKLRKITNQDAVNHDFAEGHAMSLADLIIVPCIHIFLNKFPSSSLPEVITSVYKWYKLVTSQDRVVDALNIFLNISSLTTHSELKYVLPEVTRYSLYKSDPKRYKPKWKQFTRQEDVEEALRVVDSLELTFDYEITPFGHDVLLDWDSVPAEVQPDVPESRLQRKRQQLENLAKAIIQIAKPGDKIVDFCCGSGHLGIVVAFCLPKCHVVLLDNKEESLARAKARVKQLQLTNVTTVQCNLDYFKGSFQIGTCLHACGVASDLVIETCLEKQAAFVVCPCCYGSLQSNHMISYPRSSTLKCSLSLQLYFVLGHCADQTHTQEYAKSAQGEKCMAVVDQDRCAYAKERGYKVHLAKLIPLTCSPKNNLLVGLPCT